MSSQLQSVESRVRYLEDVDAVQSVVLAFETTRDGGPENAEKLKKYLMPDVRFYWSLEDIEIKGRDDLCNYLREGMTPRAWCRHMVTNIQVTVDGDSAEATWYVMAESISRPDIKRLQAGDRRARQREPATTDTVIHSNTKGGKSAVLRRTSDGWKFQDYTIDMTRISVTHLKVR